SLLHRPLYLLSFASHSIHSLFSFNAPATPEIYTLSLHDALPILEPSPTRGWYLLEVVARGNQHTIRFQGQKLLDVEDATFSDKRSEEHTSELQSRFDLVCRLLLEKKNTTQRIILNLSSSLQLRSH